MNQQMSAANNSAKRTIGTSDATVDISVREYRVEDRDAALNMWVDGLLAAYDPVKQPLSHKFIADWVEPRKTLYDDIGVMVQARNGGCLFVAVDRRGKVLGQVGLCVTDEDKEKSTAELIRFVVIPERCGQGIGNLLLKFISEYARVELKIGSIWLETSSGRYSAYHLFQKHGFKDRKRYKSRNYQVGNDDFFWIVEMVKWLH